MADDPKRYSWFYRNSLTIVFLSFFLITLLGQTLTGWKESNEEITERGGHEIPLSIYLTSGHFISATFENFQSEFLQMGLYVVLTVFLRQVGSAESKSMEGDEEVDRKPVPRDDAPWAVKKGGWILKLYSYSLSITFLILFLFSWAAHLYGSWQEHNLQLFLMHKPEESVATFLGQPTFWFETFQNWQSEFLSVAAIVWLSIYLRHRGSPESKPVDAAHMETGK
ncbi:DUF6766 family protein [Desertivirga arenae]|uniref:DUF6766 family protein n=1 Tax=Desertivirga arenae TaxID=2810309 RepID=UPI001A974DA7|nr:DUF6766 family protein [Pedobacter sp. SYSU D00823]